LLTRTRSRALAAGPILCVCIIVSILIDNVTKVYFPKAVSPWQFKELGGDQNWVENSDSLWKYRWEQAIKDVKPDIVEIVTWNVCDIFPDSVLRSTRRLTKVWNTGLCRVALHWRHQPECLLGRPCAALCQWFRARTVAYRRTVLYQLVQEGHRTRHYRE
jgi:hypothetical protein